MPKADIISDELKEQVIEEFMKILSCKQVAERMGLSVSSVCNITEEIKKSIVMTCPVCGQKFPYKKGKKYCSGLCQVENQRGIYRYKKTEVEYKPPEPKEKQKSLTEIAIEAREHGMTYGKYVALLEQQKRGKGYYESKRISSTDRSAVS